MPLLSMTTCLMIRSTRETRISIWAIGVLIIMIFNVSQTFAHETTSADFSASVPANADTPRKLFGGKITNSGY